MKRRTKIGLLSFALAAFSTIVLGQSFTTFINARVTTQLDLQGTLTANGSTGTSGQVLTSNGAGDVTWNTPTAGVTSVALTMPSGFSVSGSPITSSGTFGVTTSLNGVLKGTGTGFTTATSADVISLWSGTCNSTTFMRADGSCQVVPAGVTGANPTATIGLTAVNGSAGTFLRSDGAPALSQSIVPTWTGLHTFTASVAALLSNANPILDWNETDGAANNRRWRFDANGETFFGSAIDDAVSSGNNWLRVNRTGTTIDSVELLGTSVSLNGVASSDFARLSQQNAFSGGAAASSFLQSINGATSSTNSLLQLKVNNAEKLTLCVSGNAGACLSGDSVGDTTLRHAGTGTLHISADNGSTSEMDITTGGVNFLTAARVGGVDLCREDGVDCPGGAVLTGTYTGAVTGCTTDPAPSIAYAKYGPIVVITIPAFSCTSNSTAFSVSGAPSTIRPASASAGTMMMPFATNNGTNVVGTTTAAMSSGGVLSFGLGAPTGQLSGWVSSGTKGVFLSTMTYSTN